MSEIDFRRVTPYKSQYFFALNYCCKITSSPYTAFVLFCSSWTFRFELHARFPYEFHVSRVFPAKLYVSPSILYEAIAVRYSVLSPPALCYCCAFAFVLPRKYHAIAAHIANYISIEFSRTDNFVPLPTLRQLKYVKPNVKPLTVELLRCAPRSVFVLGFAITRLPRASRRHLSPRHIDWCIRRNLHFVKVIGVLH